MALFTRAGSGSSVDWDLRHPVAVEARLLKTTRRLDAYPAEPWSKDVPVNLVRQELRITLRVRISRMPHGSLK